MNLLRDTSPLRPSTLFHIAGARQMLPVLTFRPVPDPFGLPAPGRDPPWPLGSAFFFFVFVGVIGLFYCFYEVSDRDHVLDLDAHDPSPCRHGCFAGNLLKMDRVELADCFFYIRDELPELGVCVRLRCFLCCCHDSLLTDGRLDFNH